MDLPKALRRGLTARHETRWSFSLCVLAVFAVAQVLAHVHHEPWRDELHCWTVGRNSPGLWDLLTGDRRYEGHPVLWYYVLHLASRVTRSYLALHAVAIGVIVSAAALWLRWAPLPRYLRVLFLGSYYFFFEYGVICRSYGLGVLLVFALCALHHPLRIRYLRSGVLLALLAATSLYGAILAIPLGWFVFSGLDVQRAKDERGRWRLSVTSSWIAGVVVLFLGLVVTVATTIPPADCSVATSPIPELSGALFRRAGITFWAAMFPFSSFESWNWLGSEYVGSRIPAVATAAPWLGAAWFGAWLFALRRRPRIAVTFGMGILAINAAQIAVYGGGWRHTGHNFVLLVACVWLHARETRGRLPDRLLHGLFAVNLLLQATTAFIAVRQDWREPFSGSTEAARFIRDHHLDNRPVVADADHPAAGVAMILERQFYFPVTGETTDWIVFYRRRSGPTPAQIVRDAERLARAGDGTALIVLNYSLNADPLPGAQWHLLYQGRPTIAGDESFWLYDFRLGAPPAGPPK
jgi:hypothetical protein